MKLLVFGGTVFLGKHVVDAALTAGHEVAVFHRGIAQPIPTPGVEWLRGDRDGDLTALNGRRFDAVIDCSGYTPQQLSASAAALAGRVGHYLFVSTRSVYRSFKPHEDFDESAAVLDGAEGYGALKARSEEAIQAALPNHVTIVRPGLIVGPFDPTGRFTYWPLRIERGGDVLAPGRPQRMVQFIDARDLASWCVTMAAGPPSGVFNVVGPSLSMVALLDAIHGVTGGDMRLHWMSDALLLANEVRPWTELPLWLPESDMDFGGLMHGSDRRATAAGLMKRPIEDTIRDTLAWASSPDVHTPKAVATMTASRESELIALLAAGDAAP
jgi:2'-hydroxyisoflavone reductase